MIAVAKADLERNPTANVSFDVADVETDDLSGTYDYAFGRCGEVEAADDVAALPASVRWFGRAAEEVGAVRRVADPFAADVDGINTQCHRLS